MTNPNCFCITCIPYMFDYSTDPAVFFKKMGQHRPLFRLFAVFSNKQYKTIFTTNQCEKMSCPSSIWRRDSNLRPSERESPPITTRPGLPPKANPAVHRLLLKRASLTYLLEQKMLISNGSGSRFTDFHSCGSSPIGQLAFMDDE